MKVSTFCSTHRVESWLSAIWSKAFYLCLSLLAFLSPGRLPAETKNLDGMATLTVALKSSVFSLHEPISGKLRVWNGRQTALVFDLGEDCRSNLSLLVTVPGGPERTFRIPRTPEGGLDSKCAISVGPGEVYERPIILNGWFEPDGPGVYRVAFELERSPIGFGAKGDAVFLIEPRNPNRLRTVCEELAMIALSPHPKEAMEASEALGFALDESCIPSLLAVLKQGFYGKEASIAALAQIDTVDAIVALASAWQELGSSHRSRVVSELVKRNRIDELDAALAKAGLSRDKE